MPVDCIDVEIVDSDSENGEDGGDGDETEDSSELFYSLSAESEKEEEISVVVQVENSISSGSGEVLSYYTEVEVDGEYGALVDGDVDPGESVEEEVTLMGYSGTVDVCLIGDNNMEIECVSVTVESDRQDDEEDSTNGDDGTNGEDGGDGGEDDNGGEENKGLPWTAISGAVAIGGLAYRIMRDKDNGS